MLEDNDIFKEYTFGILKSEAKIELVGVENGGTTATEVYLNWTDDDYVATYKLDGENYGVYSNNQKLFVEGEYRITAKDKDNNEYVYNFTINRSMDYQIVVGGKTVNSLVETNQTVQFVTDNEEGMSIGLMGSNGELIQYRWGDKLMSEGNYTAIIKGPTGASNTIKFKIDKTKPIGQLQGVSNGSKTNGQVHFSWTEGSAQATISKDGQLVGRYIEKSVIDAQGDYLIKLADKAGNFTEYKFNIDRSVDFSVNVFNGGITNQPVKIESDEQDLTIDLFKDAELIKYKFNTKIEQNGHYSFKILDEFNNIIEYEFNVLTTATNSFQYTPPEGYIWNEIWHDGESVDTTERTQEFINDGLSVCSLISEESGQLYNFNVVIDTTPPVVSLIGVDNGGSTEDIVIIVSDEEALTFVARKDNTETRIELGKEISKDGDYEIVAYDVAGNEVELKFTIDYSVNTAGLIASGLGGTGLIGALIAIVKKKKSY